MTLEAAAARALPHAEEPEGAAVAEALGAAIDALVEDVVDAVVAAVPPFAEWRGGERGVREAVWAGVAGFLERLRTGDEAQLPPRQAFFDFGRVEHRAGRSLDAVLTAYRVAAQAAWRGMARCGHAAGVSPSALYAVAESIFGYIDRLSSATAEGYAYERALAAGERVDLRQRLVELLLDGRAGADADELRRAAAAARWAVPRFLAVVAFRDGRTATVAARLPVDAAVARLDGIGYAIVPDPSGPGRLDAVRRAVAGLAAGMGPAVAPQDAPESARRALLALRLCVGPEPAPVLAEQRRLDLLLLQDAALTRTLADELRERLADEGPRGQDRLLETLQMWLGHHGAVRPTAEALGVHMQTVRYRLARLRTLLGDRLDAPGARLELELAVRAERLLAAGAIGPPSRGDGASGLGTPPAR